MGHVVEVIAPDRFRTIPCPTYSDIPLALLPRRQPGAHDRGVPARRRCTSRPRARSGMAARSWAKRTGFGIHHRVPHAVRRIPQGADRAAGAAGLCLDAPVPRRGAGHDGGDAVVARRADGARVSQHPALVARGGSGPVQAGAARGLGAAAADLPLCRPGGGGEEHRRVSRPRSAGIEGGGRRRPDPAATAARVSGRAVHRAALMARRWRAPMPARTCSCSPA